MQVHQLKKQYDLKIQQSRGSVPGAAFMTSTNYRHAILNEASEPLHLF
jgi:hypothetical protein